MASPSRRVLVSATALAAALVVPVVVTTTAAAAPTLPDGCVQPSVGGAVTCTVTYTGAATTFTVPAGVSSVDLTAWGGHGGTTNDQQFSAPGGRGALVSGTFPVSPGAQLTVTVGGDGSNGDGGFGSGHGGNALLEGLGASGGGGTAVADADVLLLVAGAGGGGGHAFSCGPTVPFISAGGLGGDAGHDGGSADDVCVVQGGRGGQAGGSSTGDGATAPPGDFQGGGAGGGGYRGGLGGGNNLNAGTCCTGAGGGGGGTSHADAAGTDVSLTGLSQRSLGANGLVQISYLPAGPLTELDLSPSSAGVSVGTSQEYTVVGYNAEGASVPGVAAQTTLSIAPDGSCTATACTPTAAGPHTVTAQHGALSTTAALDVVQAPAFASADSALFVNGVHHDFTVSASGTPAPALSISGGDLPAGLSFTDHGDGTATLGGTATVDGATDLTVQAVSDAGQVSQTLHVLVGTIAAFTSADSASFTRGVVGTMTVTVSGSPTPAVRRAQSPRLPAGLGLVDHGDGTATISGTPTGRPGTTQVRLRASNAFGTTPQLLTLVVAPVPGACANQFHASLQQERLRGTAAGDRLLGTPGDDTLLGFAGQDCLIGGAGRDGLFGDRGDDRVLGGSGNDLLKGGTGHDLLRAGAGDDVVRAADGQRDVVSCGRGHDTVVADRRDILSRCEAVTIR